jgi:hypothetical protein
MRPKFQKQSVLKFVGRIIPGAKRLGILTQASETKVRLSLQVESMTFAENELNEI